MSIKGILPELDCAIFADTGWEPDEVYEHLERLEKLSVPIHRVKAGDLRSDAILFRTNPDGRHRAPGGTADRWASMPMYVQNPDGSQGKIRRQCTADYKIAPIELFIKREILGLKPRQRALKEPVAEQWFGISVDEAHRMRTANHAWQSFEYPLCGCPEDLLPKRYSRTDCTEWLKANWPYPVPRSACLGCPFHKDSEWAKIKSNPKYWANVIEFDEAIRHTAGNTGTVFLHRSMKPIKEVDFSTAEDNGQLSLFGEDCSGMCGV
jgi:hypothetical protein